MFVMVVLGVVVVVGGTMALMGYPSRHVASEARDSSAAANTSAEAPAQPVQAATPVHVPAPIPAGVAPVRVPKAVIEKPKETPVATTRSSPADSVSSLPPVVTAGAPAGPPVPDTTASGYSTSAPAIASTTDVIGEAVTISGCLEMTVDGDEFRLTDTEGADAPKARSWRSGFLKKRSAPVELVELSDALSLRQHVGHRVMATGQLTGRELRVRSLQPAGASCD